MKTASHRNGVAAALLAAVPYLAVPYPGKATQISRKEDEVQFVLIKNGPDEVSLKKKVFTD